MPAPVMVVTRVQPVTMPTMVGNPAFIKGYPLALGVSHIDQMESSVLSGATEFHCSLFCRDLHLIRIFSNLFLNSPHRPHRSWLEWSYCCLALSWWCIQLQLQFIVVYLSGEPCWWVIITPNMSNVTIVCKMKTLSRRKERKSLVLLPVSTHWATQITFVSLHLILIFKSHQDSVLENCFFMSQNNRHWIFELWSRKGIFLNPIQMAV